ncbi:MAG: hypothetical protein EPN82_02500 [Bacteroidetes bacterium]|nr:MAG: hypothetical protein EPN82_02500 [Bacteroidota bacterium]
MRKISFVIILLCFLYSSFCQEAFWSKLPKSLTKAQNPQFIYAFGQNVIVWDNPDTLRISTNSGVTWSPKKINLLYQNNPYQPIFVFFIAAESGYACSNYYVWYYTTDQGETWNRSSSEPLGTDKCPDAIGHFQYLDENTSFFYNNNMVYRATNNMRTIESLFQGNPPKPIYHNEFKAFTFKDRNNGFLVGLFKDSMNGFKYGGLRTSDGGNSWRIFEDTPPENQDCHGNITSWSISFNPKNSNQIWIATDNSICPNNPIGTLFRTIQGWSSGNKYWEIYDVDGIKRSSRIMYLQVLGDSSVCFFNESNELCIVQNLKGNSLVWKFNYTLIKHLNLQTIDSGWACIGNYIYHYSNWYNGIKIQDPLMGSVNSLPGYWGHSIYIADPVDVVNGNYYLNENDFEIPGKFGISLERTYNSLVDTTLAFGRGWNFTFGAKLLFRKYPNVNDDSLDYIILNKGDGSRVYFLNNNNGTFTEQEFNGMFLQKHTFNLDSLFFINNQFLYKSRYGFKYNFDSSGLLLSISDRNNNQVVCDYDTNNRLETITDPVQRKYTIYYNNSNLISQITDCKNRSTQYFYNPDSTLNAFVNQVGDTAKYEYDSNKRLIKYYDFRGNLFVTNLYGDTGSDSNRVIQQTNVLGAVTLFKYDTSNHKTTVFNYKGDSTIYLWDVHHRITSQQTPDSKIESYTYDNKNNRDTLKDMNGYPYSYTYNQYGDANSEKNASGNILHFDYDSLGNMIKMRDTLGTIKTIEYNDKGLPTVVYDGNNIPTYFEYDTSGYVVKEIRVFNGDSTIITRTFDCLGNKLSETDPNSNTTIFEYDSMNRLIKVTKPNNIILQYNYDANGNKTWESDGNGNITTYNYDANNNLISVNQPLGKTTQFQYDSLNLKTKMIDANGNIFIYKNDENGKLKEENPPQGRIIKYGYDANENMIWKTTPEGDSSIYTYDSTNLLIREINPNGDTTKYIYDQRGRKIASYNCCGGSYTQYSYDGNGNTISKIDALGRQTTYQYDYNNKLIKTILPSGGYELNTYDKNGNLTYKQDIQGKITQYIYDANNKVKSIIDFQNRVYNYLYDNNFNQIAVIDPLNDTTKFVYDGLNRLTSTINPLGYSDSTVYDKLNNKLEYRDNKGNPIQYTYDSLSQLTSVTDALQCKVEYQYDISGNLIQIKYGNSRTVDGYEYDKMNRKTYEPDPPTTYIYDNQSNMIQEKDANGNIIDFDYDNAHQLIRKTYNNEDVNEYTYNLNGLMSSATDKTGRIEFQYNEKNQLISLLSNGDTIKYEYQGPNRTKMVYPNGDTIVYSYDNNNILTAINNIQLDYYENGLVRKILHTDKLATEYKYNNANWIESITSKINGNISFGDNYLYDLNGNRTQHIKTRPGLDRKLIFIEDSQNNLALSISNQFFPNGADTIIVCPKYGFESYISMSPMFSSIKVPVVFVDPKELIASPDEFNEIKRLFSGITKHAILMGDEAIITDRVKYEIEALGASTERIYTKDRIALAVNIAENHSNKKGTCFLVDSKTPYDAAMLSSISVQTGFPVLLTYPNDIPQETLNGMQKFGAKNVYLLGQNYTDVFRAKLKEQNINIIKEYNNDSPEINVINILNDNANKMPVTVNVCLGEYDKFRENISLASAITKNKGLLVISDKPENYPARLYSIYNSGIQIDTIYILATENLTTKTRQDLDTFCSQNIVNTVNYSYDGMNQLTYEAGNYFESKAYSYDKNYNRDSLITNEKDTTIYTYNEDRLTIAGKTNFEYDSAGNTILEKNNNDSVNYKWDIRGRLIEITDKKGNKYEYVYDALDRRIAIINNGVKTKVVYGDDLDAIYDVNTQTDDTTFYITGFGIDDIYQIQNGDKNYSVLKDGLGSHIGYVDANYNVVGQNDFDGFGRVNYLSRLSRYSYTGREKEKFNGLYYYRARFYNYKMGRFESRDKLNKNTNCKPSLYSFIYVKNNPILLIDPSGNTPVTVPDSPPCILTCFNPLIPSVGIPRNPNVGTGYENVYFCSGVCKTNKFIQMTITESGSISGVELHLESYIETKVPEEFLNGTLKVGDCVISQEEAGPALNAGISKGISAGLDWEDKGHLIPTVSILGVSCNIEKLKFGFDPLDYLSLGPSVTGRYDKKITRTICLTKFVNQ